MIRLMKKASGKIFIVGMTLAAVLSICATVTPLIAEPMSDEEFYRPRDTDTDVKLEKKGRDCIKMHEYGFAIPLYEAVLKRGGVKNLEKGYEGLGYAYAGKKQFPKALSYFDQAIAIAKKDKKNDAISEALRGRALIHSDNKQYDLALEDMNESLKLGQSDGRWVQRGDILMQLKQYDKAAKDYTEAIKLQPDSPQNYYARSKAYRFGHHDVEADLDMKKGNEISEKNF
jgi:tetratricopeptide (TPR) repeat protein